MTFTVRWPDGREQELYSPSLVVHDHLSTGEELPVADLVARTEVAMAEASRRVQEKYGFPCSRAAATRAAVDRAAAPYAPDATVTVVRMSA